VAPDHPLRRATDRPLPRRLRFVRWMDSYARDVWLFLVTLLLMVAMTFSFLAVQEANDRARDADRIADRSCERAKVVLPIQLKALSAAQMSGIVSKEELQVYATQIPVECRK
jgi:hypothetical protein